MLILNRTNYFRFLTFMIMVSTFLPVIFNNLPPIVRSHHIWTILWFISLLFYKPKILLRSQILLLMAYCVIVLIISLNTIWIDVPEWHKTNLFDEFYQISVAISLLLYFRLEGDYIGLAKIIKATIIFFVITAFMTILTSIINPMYARDIIGVSDIKNEFEASRILAFSKFGGAGYGYASALVCIFPILIYFLKNWQISPLKKGTLFFLIAVFLIALIRLQIFANILVSVIVSLVAISGSKRTNSSVAFVAVFTLLIIIIPNQIFASFFQNIASLFDSSSELYSKFNDFASFISIGALDNQTGAGGRASRYPVLIELFLINPLFGHSAGNAPFKEYIDGYHLHFMFKLAIFGLFGTGFFLIIIYKTFKENLVFFNREYTFYFTLSYASYLLLGLMKTIAGREFWYTLLFIIPGLYYLSLLKKSQPKK